MTPTGMAKGITTLVPKVIGTTNPGEFRPITVTSTFSRLYHCILGERFSNTLPYNDRQKGFKKGDGLYFNSKLLQKTINEAKENYKNLKVAFVDVAKAFDSVSHQTLWVACRRLGVPEHIVSYLKHFYAQGTTRIKLPGKLGRVIEIKRGIKQGDPLSVHLFNAVIELCTEKLDKDIGYEFKNGANLTFMAYADDIILFSKTESGLKHNFKILEDQLALCGLNINYKKSATLGITSKRKKWVCNPKPILKNDQGTITALTINDTYKYLGVKIGALGAIHTPKEDYIKAMENITKAPLKPQQRLKILREHLIPKLLHQLVISTVGSGSLKHLDALTRSYTKKWLKIKINCSKAIFHATADDGGLNIQSFLYLVPLLRYGRNCKLLGYDDPLTHIVTENVTTPAPVIAGTPVTTKGDVREHFGKLLHSSVDGKGLLYHTTCPKVHQWVRTAHHKWLTGRDFIRAVHLRHNLLPSGMMLSRLSSAHSKSCPVCVNAPYTVAHILQQCPRSHGARIKRHNAICKYVAETMTKLGFKVEWEPMLRTTEGPLKPDLLASIGECAYIIDIAICSDGIDPDKVYLDKITKYGPVADALVDTYSDITLSAFVVNWRGAIAKRTLKDFEPLVTSKGFSTVSVRTLQYGNYIWDMWNRSTVVSFAEAEVYNG